MCTSSSDLSISDEEIWSKTNAKLSTLDKNEHFVEGGVGAGWWTDVHICSQLSLLSLHSLLSLYLSFLSFCLSHHLSLSLSRCLSPSLSLSLSLSLCPCLSVCMYMSFCLSGCLSLPEGSTMLGLRGETFPMHLDDSTLFLDILWMGFVGGRLFLCMFWWALLPVAPSGLVETAGRGNILKVDSIDSAVCKWKKWAVDGEFGI